MAKQQKTKHRSSSVHGTSAKKGARPVATDLPSHVDTIVSHAIIFVAAFVIVVSRRPDAVLNAQFFAEDGVVWYADAYNFGLHSLVMPQASYLHTLTRLIALLALLFPFSLAPLVMNLCAITVQVLPVNVFLSSRFAQIAFRTRLLACFSYLALPNTFEIDANITTIQWHLALLACLLLLARPATGWQWRIFSGIVLVMISLDGPIGIVLVPLAAATWWIRRQVWDKMSFALLVPGFAIQVLSMFLSWHSRQVAPNGPTLSRLITILGGQVFLPSLLGLNTVSQLTREGTASFIVEVVAAFAGLALLLYAVRYSPMELKLFILFAFAVFALCLARPLAGPPHRPQWDWLCVPGCGNRYFFLPMLSFLAALLWIARGATGPRTLRYLGVALLLLLTIGIYQDWHYPPFVDLHFQEYAAQFEHAPSGTRMSLPINPGWTMDLTKR